MCVQSSSVLRVLQFTPFNVVCYVLHRSVSQVIHGQQLSSLITIASVKSTAVIGVEEASRLDFKSKSVPAIPSLIKRATSCWLRHQLSSLHTTSPGRLIHQPSQRLTICQPHHHWRK